MALSTALLVQRAKWYQVLIAAARACLGCLLGHWLLLNLQLVHYCQLAGKAVLFKALFKALFSNPVSRCCNAAKA